MASPYNGFRTEKMGTNTRSFEVASPSVSKQETWRPKLGVLRWLHLLTVSMLEFPFFSITLSMSNIKLNNLGVIIIMLFSVILSVSRYSYVCGNR